MSSCTSTKRTRATPTRAHKFARAKAPRAKDKATKATAANISEPAKATGLEPTPPPQPAPLSTTTPTATSAQGVNAKPRTRAGVAPFTMLDYKRMRDRGHGPLSFVGM